MTQPGQREPDYQQVAGNLQERIAQQAARYEGEIALLREQYQYELNQLQAQLQQSGQQNVVEPPAGNPAPAADAPTPVG